MILAKVQVTNFEKVPFVQHFTEVLICRIPSKFFDKIENKRDFLKIINLYRWQNLRKYFHVG